MGGGIAAYKVGDLVRELGRRGAQVRVAMTPAAQAFVTPLTLQSLSGHRVLLDVFDLAQDENFGHLHLARWAEVFVVAPATADLIARLRAGMANDAVTTALLAFRGPVVLAPAMNTAMWDNALTQQNVQALLSHARFRVVGPGVGALADGDVGAGRLADLADLVRGVDEVFAQGPLAGKKVLISAGPTREPLDPVRFLSNPSTGKMGLAMADEAAARGAQVTVVLGPVPHATRDRHEIVDVVTAEQMATAVLTRIDDADYFVSAAAVSDWTPCEVADRKMKKTAGPLRVTLVRTTDILATASARVRMLVRRPVLVGFAAETHEVEASASSKLRDKNLDFVVANDVSVEGAGFASETNSVIALSAAGRREEVEGTKHAVAARLWDFILGG